MTDVKQAILNYITERRWVSFAELTRHIPEFEGDVMLFFPETQRYSNICLWPILVRPLPRRSKNFRKPTLSIRAPRARWST